VSPARLFSSGRHRARELPDQRYDDNPLCDLLAGTRVEPFYEALVEVGYDDLDHLNDMSIGEWADVERHMLQSGYHHWTPALSALLSSICRSGAAKPKPRRSARLAAKAR
jgi:hypothetical protein